MNEIEEIVRDRIVIELESLKRDLKEEIKRLESESESSNIPSYSTYLQYLVEGIEVAINKIEKKNTRKDNVIKYQTFTFLSFFIYFFLSFIIYHTR